MLKEPYDRDERRQLDLNSISGAFTLLNGSREKFAAFAAFMKFDTAIVDLLLENASLSDAIRHSVNRAIMTGKINTAFLEEKLMTLKSREAQAISRLKEGGIAGETG